MGSNTFLFVDDQPIPIAKVLQYLQITGKMDGFIGVILRQYVVEQELQNNTDLNVTTATIEQVAAEFRLQNQLATPDQFREWLAEQGIDETQFRQRVQQDLRLGQLRTQVTQPRLQEYFIERKLYLDQVVLSRIVVASPELAEELKQQIEEGASFEQLASEYSTAEDGIFNGMMGLVSRGELPDNLRSAIDLATPGDLLGPLELDGTWSVFRYERSLPASLDNPQIQQMLQNELFDQWAVEKLQRMKIEVRIEE
ncbi:peptidylprolyl isomerase [Oscillatoria sp. FACHB-1407]|uniref:peptidylprolyl isomerase n=1 Tax=Oscillatoria sp. FACHB-1407 TaxID=2692847 RepID=UPI0016876E3F|nr:peptidylprolyl isomerase [Oscillatoria sp. FACHB-1407]MBD2460172.1 peptidylprolyl isomerase [Oscillatoria sp. FACHB-1407]